MSDKLPTPVIPGPELNADGSAAKSPRYERWRWQIFAITWLAYAGLYLTRKPFSVAKIGIQQDPSLHMSTGDLTVVDFWYLVAYAIGQFLFGTAGDRLGTRLVIGVGMLVSVFAAIAMGASTLTIAFGAFFCIQGLAQSTGWGPLIKNMSTFFSRRERGGVMGLWSTCYPLGGFLASALAGWAGDQFGWRYAFYVPATVLLGVWLLFLFLQRNRPEDVGLPPIEEYHRESPDLPAVADTTTSNAATTTDAASQPSTDAAAVATLGNRNGELDEHEKGSWQVIREVITNPMVLLLGAVYFLLKPTRYAILFWGPKYLNARMGSGMFESGTISALFELAGPLGALAAGLISDRLLGTRRVPVCVVCLVLLSGALFVFDRLPSNRWILGTGFFAIGLLLFAPDSLVAGAAAVDFGTKRGASTASGLVNGFGSIGAVIGGTAPGLNERWGWGPIFMLLGAMALLAAVILAPRWNALPKSPKS